MTNWTLYLIAALGAALAALGVHDAFRGAELNAARADARALQARLDAAAIAADSKDVTIRELRAVNEDNAAKSTASKWAAEAAYAQVGAMRDQLAALRAASKQRSDEIYANDPECGDVGRRPVCAALSGRMRERTGMPAYRPD